MQKHYTLLLALFVAFTLSSLRAQSAEGFDYTAGETIEGLSGGDNWDGPWVVLKGNDQSAVVSGGIATPAVGASTSGNHMFVNHAGTGGLRAFRKLATPVTDDGNTYYMSWFQDADFPAGAPGGSVAQAIITRGDNFGAGGPGGQLVRMGKIFGSEQFGTDGANGLAAQLIAGTNTSEALFAIAKITMSGNTDLDTVRIFVNPELSVTELDNAAADQTRTVNLNDGFDAFGFKVEGGAPLNSAFDEFRFGSALVDVIGDDLVLTPGVNADQFNDYAAGDGLDGAAGGIGWAAPWEVVGGDDPTITDDGIDNFTILRATSGNGVAAEFSGDNGNTRFLRRLNAPFPDDGSTYYFSYSQLSTYTNRGQQVNYFMLIDSETYAATGPGGQLVQVGKNLNTPFIGAGIGGTNNFEMTNALAEEAHLVVVKVSTSGNGDADTVRVFIDPQPGATEPAEADATKLIGTNLNGGFDAVGFKVEGLVPGNAMFFDDVLVGLSFDDVIPTDRTELEPLSDAFAVESFNTYGPGDELIGLDGGQGWDGSWQDISVSDSAVIAGRGLVNEQLLARTGGNSVRMTTTGQNQRIIRYFEEAIDTMTTSEFWFAVQLGVSGNVMGNVGNFILADTSRSGPNFQQVIVGKGFGNRNLFAGGFGGGGNQPTGETFGGDASWVVGHMTRDTGVWSLDVFVNPDPAAGTPDESAANIVNKAYANAANFHGVTIKAEGTGVGLNWDVDDIYLGAEFADVIPPDLVAIPAAPLGASETFDYAEGAAIVGADGGEGWTGPWRAVSADATVAATADGISSFPLAVATSGQSARLTDYQRVVRPLAGAYGDNGRDFWIGWWMDVDNVGGNVAQFVLADTMTYAATGPGGQLVQIGNLFSGGAIGSVPGTTAEGITAEDGHFLVAHVITNGTAANDQVIVWVDPALDVMPSADTASFTGAADLTNWNGVGFKFEGNAGLPTEVAFDDILIARTFAEVVPTDLIEITPPNQPVAATELFAYDAGTSLGGADGGAGWAGPWSAVAGDVTVGTASLESDRTCGEGNEASLDQTGETTPVTLRRDFFAPFGAGGGTSEFYASFLLDVDMKDIGNSGGFSLTDPAGDDILFVGGVSGISTLAASANGGTPETTNAITAAGAKWFVVKMTVDGATGTASALVFVDPSADAIPADASAVFSFDGIDVTNGIAGVALRGSGIQSVSLLADDIRAGFSYRDISCKFGSDDPALLAYEPFNYDAGRSLDGAGGINAFWDGPWEQEDLRENSMTAILAGNLEYPDYDPLGNRVEFNHAADAEGLTLKRNLAFPVESDGSTYWLTYLMNTTDPTAPNNIGIVTLVNTNIGDRGGRRFGVGRNFGTQRLGTIVVTTNTPRTTNVDDNGLHWLVCRVQTTDVPNGLDTVSLWIDPSLDTEPDTADASHYQYFTTAAFQEGFNAIHLRVLGVNGNEAPYVTEFDELRLATSWQSARLVVNTIDPHAEDELQVSAYPNPTAGELTVNFVTRRAGPVSADMYNLKGELVRSVFRGTAPAGSNSYRIDLSANGLLPNGMYLLRVSDGVSVSTRKIIIYR